MASSMLSADRRLVPTRKGMTVLGKVPKPINLPSQRLENHGMDAGVEIVPKGTLTWGSRPSPATPNAWGLSNHSSSNAETNVDSLSHFSCRPSSSGGGTRSTAGNDISGEHVASAWKSSSRPSSASGLLVSNQTQQATRPRSADTRPGSSQLSRFADPAVGNAGPWGSAGTTQKTGPASPETMDFSLSSGDFPTLGSEKNSELHCEPDSHAYAINASTTVSIEKNSLEVSHSGTEKIDVQPDKGNVKGWKTQPPLITGDTSANIGSWDGNLHNMHLATNISPAQSLSNPRHAHPQNPFDGVWCRGVPSSGSYRSQVAPSGNSQSDSFTYYPSQIPVMLDPNLHCVPRAGGHLTGYQNKVGEGFRPHSPDPFMVPIMPVIPVRPGVHHGSVPYDGHSSPAGFGEPTVRERSIMGLAPGPPVYGLFPNQTFQRGPVHMPLKPSARSQLSDDKVESTHQRNFATAPYKVLLKHHNHPVGTDSESRRDQTATSMTSSLDQNTTVEAVCGQGLQQKVVKDVLKNSITGKTLHSNDLRDCSEEAAPTNLSEKRSERAGDNMLKKADTSTASAEAIHLTTNDIKLIEKIETLNNKAPVADGHLEGPLTKDDNHKRADDGNPTQDGLRNNVPSGFSFDGSSGTEPPTLMSMHGESAISSKIKTLECRSVKVLPDPSATHASTFSTSSSSDGNKKAHAEYRRIRNIKGDHLCKARVCSEEDNSWTKQLTRKDSLVSPNGNCIHDVLLTEEFSSSQDHSNIPVPFHMDKPRDEPDTPSSLDSVDYKTQRAMMKEIAMRRVKQLQQDEEERNREQKAKALAKLVELNQRCNSSSSSETRTENNDGGSTSYGVEIVKTSGDVPQRHDGSTPVTSEPDGRYCDRITFKHKNDKDKSNLEERNPPLAAQLPDMDSSKPNAGKKKGTKTLYPDSSNNCHCSGGLTASADRIVSSKNGPADLFKKNNTQYHDNSSSKEKQVGHRRKQKIPEERNLEAKAVACSDIASPDNLSKAAPETALGGKLVCVQSNETCNSPIQQRINERIRENKTKSEVLEGTYLTSAVQAKGILGKPADIHRHNQKFLKNESVLSVSKTENSSASQNFEEITGSSNQSLLQGGSVKPANHWKPNPSRRPSRNVHSRMVDKFQGNDNVVWAPVRLSTGEPVEESHHSLCHGHVIGNSSTSSTGINNPGDVKSRRAEIQRYVPKVVKDAQQEGNLQISDCQSPVEMALTDNAVPHNSKEDGFSMSDPLTLKKNAEHGRTNREGKNYGAPASWRQHSSEDGSVDAVSTGVYISEQKQREDVSSSSHAAGYTPNDTSKETPGVSNFKVQGNTSKIRRQMQKAHKAAPTDAEDFTGEVTGKFEVQSLALDRNAMHVKSTATESLIPVERSKSQWKPKPQTVSSHGNQQDAGSGGEKVSSQTGTKDKDCRIITDQHARVPDRNIAWRVANGDERLHQPRSERKELAVNHNVKAGQDAEDHQGQPALSPKCQQPGVQHMKGKDVRYRGRFHKGQDNSYGNSAKQNIPVSGDRQRQTSHYEYQRTGAYNSSDQFQTVAPHMRDIASGLAATGPKFHEKAQGHKKGVDHFYVRSSSHHLDDKTSGQQS